ncbi:glycosyltransferase [Rhizobium leguminosarum]|uniref:CgeB family protein n=1 Tax=Rhizobium leguminosarum TaxID=384 RepID=UPI001FED4611|nr:glycosyltransferase [Rhizobium leguminosarum]
MDGSEEGKPRMRIVIFDTYYRQFLARYYATHPEIALGSFDNQRHSLLSQFFGTSDFYSRHLNKLGWEAHDLIGNCVPLQMAWARENDFHIGELSLKIPHRFFRVPLIGPLLSSMPGLLDVAVAQIRQLKPDVLYCQDLSFFPSRILKEMRSDIRLIVGQIASPLPPSDFLSGYDLILTSFPHFVDRIRALGIRSEYFRIAFERRVLDELGVVEKNIDVSFVGGISAHHKNAIPVLEHLARNTNIAFFGYGARNLPQGSPILAAHQGEVWGLDMYRALARSRITINRHIAVAENYANNMRLYEATGVGSLLLTDRKTNLGELFVEGREVVTYSDAHNAVEQIKRLLQAPDEMSQIAAAGQRRTLGEHTYEHRMRELIGILEHHIDGHRGTHE